MEAGCENNFWVLEEQTWVLLNDVSSKQPRHGYASLHGRNISLTKPSTVCCWLAAADPFTFLALSFPIWLWKVWTGWSSYGLSLWQPEFTCFCTVCFHDIPRRKPSRTRHPLTLALSLRGFPRIPYNVVEEKRCLPQPPQMPSIALPPCLCSYSSLCPSLCLSRTQSKARHHDKAVTGYSLKSLGTRHDAPFMVIFLYMSAVPNYSVNSSRQDQVFIPFSIPWAQLLSVGIKTEIKACVITQYSPVVEWVLRNQFPWCHILALWLTN